MRTGGKSILLVDADDALRRSLAELLAGQGGLTVVEAGTAAGALAGLPVPPPDAALVDATLPDMAGGDLCRVLRAAGLEGPLFLLLSPGMPAPPPDPDGAGEHVAKPIRLSALLARLGEKLSRVPGGGVAIGPYRFDAAAKRLETTDGRRIRLTEKETRILDHLHRHDAPVPREALLDAVWGYGAGIDTHTLETHIYRLRRKIEPDPDQSRLLVTVAGGYRLVP
ncbi:response regulator transcription factor [Niveispirillum fermenti]|uniref:response regulator transcription factor n=1 Tax=Niveispirillum fermenti TaxID=1233113 RepID=UPI003A83D411